MDVPNLPPSSIPSASDVAATGSVAPSRLLFGLDDRPPLPKAILATVAHLLAIVGGIATAPLLIAQGLGLDALTTNYIIGSALMVSGIATFIQVRRIGPLGSGLLSVQGTSFSFIGAMMFAGSALPEGAYGATERVGVLLGSAAAGALLTVVAGYYIERLGRVITPTVTGIAIFLLGLTLTGSAWRNLGYAIAAAEEAGVGAAQVWVQVAIVVSVVVGCALQSNVWLRLSSITLGLLAGLIYCALTGQLIPVDLSEAPGVHLLQVLAFPLGFDLGVCLILLPIFFVTMTEALGDLTATSMLSNQPTSGPAYWQRVRGGVMADGFNSAFAAILGTFPNTTFSQNNAVIQLTGVASRFVGLMLAGLLVLLGALPAFAALFQSLPGGVLHGATGLLFIMIGVVGVRMLHARANARRTWVVTCCCVAAAFALTWVPGLCAEFGVTLPAYLALLLSFPVASGVLLAVLWELLWPDSTSAPIVKEAS